MQLNFIFFCRKVYLQAVIWNCLIILATCLCKSSLIKILWSGFKRSKHAIDALVDLVNHQSIDLLPPTTYLPTNNHWPNVPTTNQLTTNQWEVRGPEKFVIYIWQKLRACKIKQNKRRSLIIVLCIIRHTYCFGKAGNTEGTLKTTIK